MELLRKRTVRQRSWAQSEPCWAQSNQSVRDAACSSPAQVALRSYFLSFCMELSCQSCLAELFLKLSHGTVVQNLLCEAIFWAAFVWNCRAKVDLQSYLSRWNVDQYFQNAALCCAVLLRNGRGLGRSLSNVGRSQVSLLVMLHALVHKLPCEDIS